MFTSEWQYKAKLQTHPSQDTEYEQIVPTQPNKIPPPSGVSEAP